MPETNPSSMPEQDPKQDSGVDEGGMDTTSELDEGAGIPTGMDDMGDSGVDEEDEDV